MANPLNCGLLDGERLSVLRINPTLERGSERDCGGTADATAARREVSELTITGNSLSLGGKLARQLDSHTNMPAFLTLIISC